MRTLSGLLAGHLDQDATTTCHMLRLDLVDGSSVGITDHSHDLTFDLGDGELSYSSRTGAAFSSVTLAAGFDVSNFEVTGPVGETFTKAGLLGGRYQSAKARLFLVNWADLAQGSAALMQGRVAQCRIEGAQFVMEVRNAAAAFNVSQGDVLSPMCRADFGVASTGCPVTREWVPCTVTAVESDFVFAVDLGGTYSDNHFFLGGVRFLTGELAGTSERKIFAYDGTNGAMELFEPLVAVPEVGDTLEIARGCSKLLKHTDPLVPTCLSYDAVTDFRGEPEVPGNRTYQRVSAPGASYA